MGYSLLCQLTTAYRRLTRPSSPPTAKASTTYAYSLDHITPKNLKLHARVHNMIDNWNTAKCSAGLYLITIFYIYYKNSIKTPLTQIKLIDL